MTDPLVVAPNRSELEVLGSPEPSVVSALGLRPEGTALRIEPLLEGPDVLHLQVIFRSVPLDITLTATDVTIVSAQKFSVVLGHIRYDLVPGPHRFDRPFR